MCILYILNQDAFQSNVKTNSIQRKITQKQRKPLKKNGPSKTTHAHMLYYSDYSTSLRENISPV